MPVHSTLFRVCRRFLLVGVVVSMNMFFLMWASAYRQMVPSRSEASAPLLAANPLPVGEN